MVLAADGRTLHHYHRAQDRPDRGWTRAAAITGAALGPGALAEVAGTLHVLVPQDEGVVHYRSVADSWHRVGNAGPGRAVSLAAVDDGLLAALTEPDGVALWRFTDQWRRERVIEEAGSAALAVSGSRAVAAVAAAGVLRWWESVPRGWIGHGSITEAGTAAASIAPVGGAWLLAVPRADRIDTYLVGAAGAAPAETLTWGAGRIAGVALAPSGLRGWVQALTDEDGSLFHHHRQTTRARIRWMRSACLRLADPASITDPVESVKLAQVSGEVDAQPTPWGERRPTLSRSASSAGVRGTDLGVRIDHAGQSYLLFGDTHWRRRPWLTTRDAIARVTPEGPLAGLPGVQFHGSPLKVVGGRVTMREYDVPLDGFSLAGDLFVFFSSDHFAREQPMGRSVLTRALDPALPIDPAARGRPLRFRLLAPVSDRYFINVSVQPFPASALPGFAGTHDVHLLFGSGAYRAGDLRLAVLDPAAPGVGAALRSRRPVPTGALGLRYWTGLDGGRPVWSEREDDARPLLHPGAFGELSVRWVPAIQRFLLLAGGGPEDPIGPAITLRTAPTPWGPWSPRRRLLDWITTGMSHHDPFSRFIRAHADDPVGDRIFRVQASMTGAAYAPYLFDAVVEGADLVLRYTLSTWNPYQVVLMRHRLPLADL